MRRASHGAWFKFALALSLFGLLALLLTHSETLQVGVRSALPRFLQTTLKQPTLQLKEPEIYNWTTHSQFTFPKDFDSIDELTPTQLCQYFPTHLLNDHQPILKTGHNILVHRLPAQLSSVSACLPPYLLLISDHSEIYSNTPIIDALSEIPPHLLLSVPDQLSAYIDPSNSSDSQNWALDKFKFLSSISATWRLRPEKRWYIFYEGDTFILWDNLFRFLQNFDADEEWYFGSPSPGGKDPKTEKTVWFANGGPGYVVSRGAMRKMVRGDRDEKGVYTGSQLTEKYWERLVNDCCGDSVLGWAFSQTGIGLSGMWPMFNPHPPHGVPFSDRYWCEPVLTMHKPHVDMMESLWRWQFKAREPTRPLLYRDLALSYWNVTALVMREDWDNADFDGYQPEDANAHKSVDECRHSCEGQDDCFQWTFSSPDRCTFVRSFRMGQAKAPENEHRSTSGWITSRIQQWADDRPCDHVRWVTPSTTRIF